MFCRKILSLLVALLTVLIVGGVGGADPQAVIQGSASYRERMALPPEAVFGAVIADVSLADAAAEVIGRVRMESPGQVPIRFEIPYDAERIREGRRYAVRGYITLGGELWFTTDRFYRVLTGGHSARVDLMMIQVSALAPPGRESGAARLGPMPANVEGDLPAADGPGIRYHLDLFPDQTFALRIIYLGRKRDAQSDDIGTWSVSPDGGRLSLKGGREAPLDLSIQDPGTLRKLDLEGREIDSGHNYSLTRREPFDPIEPRLLMRGMYRYQADAGIFQECLTGWELPVAQEADNAALEFAYANVRMEPGKPILVTVEGRVAFRPPIEGAGIRKTFVPERFIKVWPGETCGPRQSAATLENTYWKLTRLGSKPAEIGTGGREVHLMFSGEGLRVQGFSGCNRFTGSYRLEGKRLAFKQMAGTRMACVEGMEQEAAILEAFEATASWQIMGEHLELMDAGGRLLLRFKAKNMK
jgi:copper homeostasis protein (lipoprotein)